jgi:hypothetical protein
LRNTGSVDNMSHVEQPDVGLQSIRPDEVIAAANSLLKDQDD